MPPISEQSFTTSIGRLVMLVATCLLLTGTGCIAPRHFWAHAYRLDPTLEALELEQLSQSDPQTLPQSAEEVLRGMQRLATDPRGESGSENEPQPDPIYPQYVELTLDLAVDSALAGNLDLQVALFDPAVATQQVQEELWRFESTFRGAVSRRRSDPPPGSALLGSPPETAIDRFEPEFAIPLTTGGELAFQNEGSRFTLPGTPSANIHDLAPTVRYRQPLLRGAWPFVNTARIRLAYLDLGRADAVTKLTAIRVVADTERAYWILLGTQKVLEIGRQQVAVAEQLLAVAKRLAEAGVVSNVDVLRSQSGLVARREAVVRAERGVLLATRELKRVMQLPELPVDSPTAIEIASEPNLVGLQFDRALLSEKALSNRLELVDLALQIQQQTVDLNLARNSVLPELDFVFEGRLLGTGPTSGRASFQAWNDDYDEWFAGFTFSVPLAGNQSARRRTEQIALLRAQTQSAQARLEVDIVTQINNAVDAFEKNWERILVSQEAVSVSQKTYQAETRLFELGQRTSDLVLLSAADLANAQLQLVQSVVDFQLSRIDIALATGTVLGYSRLGRLE